MKDDALPQNPGMCLQYTHRQGCMLSLHAKDVGKGACLAMGFLMHINAAQNIKQILPNQSGLAFFLTCFGFLSHMPMHRNHKRRPATIFCECGVKEVTYMHSRE